MCVCVTVYLYCISQDYWKDVWNAYKSSNADQNNIQLVVIGCGTVKLGRSLAMDLGAIPKQGESSNSHQDLFRLYVDPKREAYTSLGLKHKTVVTCGKILKGMWRAVVQGITKCWCMCSSGDVEQQGGVFVLNNNGECLFKHIEDNPQDHADIKETLRAAGAN
jgi:hypothetical protein